MTTLETPTEGDDSGTPPTNSKRLTEGVNLADSADHNLLMRLKKPIARIEAPGLADTTEQVESNPMDMGKVVKDLKSRDHKFSEPASEALKKALEKDPITTITQLAKPIVENLGSSKYDIREGASEALKQALAKDSATTVIQLAKALEHGTKDAEVIMRLSNALGTYAPKVVSDALDRTTDLTKPVAVVDLKTIANFKNLSEQGRQDQQVEVLSSWRKLIDKSRLTIELNPKSIDQQLKDLENFKVLQEKIAKLEGTFKGSLTLEDAGNPDMNTALKDLNGLTWPAGLTALNIRGTQVTDAGLKHLNGITGLTKLNLSGTKITDTGLEHLSHLTKLTELYLSHTELTDMGLPALNDLNGLTLLDLSGTKITDAGLPALQGLTKLVGLNLMNTKVTDAGITNLKLAGGLFRLRVNK